MLFTAEQIQVLYECAMSIGTSLDLRTMLRTSVSTILKKTSCAVGIVFMHEKGEDGEYLFRSAFSIPRDVQRIQDIASPLSHIPEMANEMDLAAFNATLPLHGKAGEDSWYHLMPLKDVGGILLLKRGNDLAPHTVQALLPLFDKLAQACLACLQNDELLRHQNNLEELVMEKSGELLARNDELAKEVEVRTQAEAELKKTTSELQALFAAMTDAVFILNDEGRYLEVAPTSPDLLYAPADDLVGSTVEEVFPKESADYFMAHIRTCLDTGLTISLDYDLVINGKTIWFEGRISQIADDAVVLVARDITIRRLAQMELEALNKKLDRMAHIDALTQIFNRRFFDATLEMEWRRMVRQRLPLSLILIDIDFFKNYNDHYGHVAGDQALKAVAQAIAANLKRPGDIVARYGGEEFAILLPNTDAKGAAIIGEDVKKQVEGLNIVHEKSEVCETLTISLGVACIHPKLDMDTSYLIKLSDDALYVAKSAGRNQCRLAENSE